jgi:hypothetical protein
VVPEPGELDDEDQALLAEQVLRAPAPLFKKLDESVVEEEYARLEG